MPTPSWSKAQKDALETLLQQRKEFESVHLTALRDFIVQQLGGFAAQAEYFAKNAAQLIQLLEPFDPK